MTTKRILPLLLIMLVLFASCGEVSSGIVSSNYWKDWIKDVPQGKFEQADSENFTLEQNGYLIECTLDKWGATRGSSEYLMHPASSEIPLPLLKPSDCVIPFMLTVKTATKDTSLTTDFYFGAYAIKYNAEYDSYVPDPSYSVYGCELSRFESTVEYMTKYFDDIKSDTDDKLIQELLPQYHVQVWPQSISDNYSDTMLGDEQVVIGCYVINGYYSPEFPEGNLEKFPDNYALMRVSMKTPNTHITEEIDVVVH